jgi:hypothetical protein
MMFSENVTHWPGWHFGMIRLEVAEMSEAFKLVISNAKRSAAK